MAVKSVTCVRNPVLAVFILLYFAFATYTSNQICSKTPKDQ